MLLDSSISGVQLSDMQNPLIRFAQTEVFSFVMRKTSKFGIAGLERRKEEKACTEETNGRMKQHHTCRKVLSGLSSDLVLYLASFGCAGCLALATGIIFWGFFTTSGSSMGQLAPVWSLVVTATGA